MPTLTNKKIDIWRNLLSIQNEANSMAGIRSKQLWLAIASFRFFTNWGYFYLFFAVFAFLNRSTDFSWSMFTYDLRELQLTQKMIQYNTDQPTSQFEASAQVIFLRKSSRLIAYTNLYFRPFRKASNSLPIFTVCRCFSIFFFFSLEIRDYSSTIILTQKSRFDENCWSEGIQ